MKYRSASRNLVPAVLVLVLAAVSAPVATALPAASDGSGAPHWDAGAFFGWLHSVLGHMVVGDTEDDSGIQHIQEQAKVAADPDGRQLTSSSADAESEERPAGDAETLRW